MTAHSRLLSLLLALFAVPIANLALAVDAPPTPKDPGWPRTFVKAGNQVQIYPPQIDEWTNHSKIAFHAAIAVQPNGEKQPTYGVLAVKADTLVDDNSRLVLMTNLDPTVQFPNAPPKQADQLKALIKEVLPHKDYLEVSLDRVLAYMHVDQAKPPTVQVDLNPPPIYYSDSPSILVIFAGQPQFKPVKGTQLMFAVNTNWNLLLDLTTSQYYLLNEDAWLTAPDPLKGPWTPVQALPGDFAKLPADANWEEVRKHIPALPPKTVPKVITSTTPAELIVTSGAPDYTPIVGTKLLYSSNPVMPLFMNAADASYYYLVAGRWFHAKSLNGPWSAASTNLPADFSKIPADSPVGFVLASVPKTPQAQDAVLLASIPHTATVNINEAKINVTYDGNPNFVPIQGTPMTYAINTPYDVIFANGRYYCCYQGVWFVSPAATGPWAVCTSVPAIIYTIPPTSPLYNVTYVRVYDTTPSTVVVGYTAGYTGEYVAATGVLMFGAGMLTGALLASNENYYCYHYNPGYFSYGCGANYSYAYGGYYRAGAAYYGPYGGAGRWASYNSATGTYSRGAYQYGPHGAGYAHQAYNPFTDTYHAHAGATNGYQSWGHSVVSRGDQWAQAGHVAGPRGAAGWVETSSGKEAAGFHAAAGAAVKTGSGDIYAGKDGNVYRRSDGQWQHYNDGGWQDVSHSSHWNQNVQQHMNSEWQSRSHGETNAYHADQLRSEGFSRSSYGSHHTGGFGGFHGGGFGRR
ncbi:MAG TPA: hypothetical protein VHP11_16255 [Tepidisphaeraceae bacterium]|nr:hypothetical protein [Tepidisphaeraceae bacterium]